MVASMAIMVSCSSNKNKQGNSPYEAQIEEILSGMTLEEKVGQMTQLTLDVLTVGGLFATEMPLRIDEAMMDTVFGKYKVGSILNTISNTPMTIEQWHTTVKAIQDRAIKETGIPVVYGVDQIHGTTYTIDGTLFPQAIGMGATFNPELVRQGAEVTAYETKAGSLPWNFSPVVDLGRDARWPRQWETFGEDSYLVSVMGDAATVGYQGEDYNKIADDRVAACLKHFMGYGTPASGKDRTPSYISEQDMRERHFAPFLSAVRKGALSVMVNSAMNNGMPFHINAEYMNKWLKEDLNWDGVIVTDWADINNIHSRDKVTATKKEAIKLAINAGVDMSMVPYEWSFAQYLKELVEEGEVSMERIDDAVRRILRMKFRLNLFDKPYYNPADFSDFGSEKHAKVALDAALESITLLKNSEDVLPLSKGAKVLVTGPTANSMRTLNGGWTLSWQGEKADIYAEKYNTILEAVQNYVGSENVVYSEGVGFDFESSDWKAEKAPRIQEAVRAAQGVDYIIACVGENSYCETPGNIDDLTLSQNQLELVKSLAKTGKPIILVLNEGRPRIINEIEPLVKAVVQTYLPGNYGGDALAQVLWGDYNPSGKLPYTYPRYVHSLSTYDFKPCEQRDVMEGAYNYDAVVSTQWAFGYGLSYTSFEYSDLSVNQNSFTADDTLEFTINVKNTGAREGKESILLFSSDEYASLTPDRRRLRAFAKVSLEAGKSENVTLRVPAKDLAFVGYDGRWRLEEGDFAIQIGNEEVMVNCTQTHVWNTPNM